MEEPEKRERLAALDTLCREQGVPRTSQRRVILETLLDLDNHPTADQVLEAVSRRRSEISRATVYRTLETLVRMGLIMKTSHPGRVVRYDPHVDRHHHLVCLRCDEVIDVYDRRLDALPLPDLSALGFDVSDYRVQLRGLCRECAERESTPPKGG